VSLNERLPFKLVTDDHNLMVGLILDLDCLRDVHGSDALNLGVLRAYSSHSQYRDESVESPLVICVG